ncbi:hypothetical protein CDEN61S_02804 [Castellaniella denitrificans]
MSASAIPESAGQEPVLFQEIPARGGRRIGVATLNSPRTLNGLSLPMCRLSDARLQAWADDDGIAAVVLKGAGGKAFCAGGDLHALYRAMLRARRATPGPTSRPASSSRPNTGWTTASTAIPSPCCAGPTAS